MKDKVQGVILRLGRVRRWVRSTEPPAHVGRRGYGHQRGNLTLVELEEALEDLRAISLELESGGRSALQSAQVEHKA